MKERPILFSGTMVNAILDGRKTQTRRIVKNVEGNSWKLLDSYESKWFNPNRGDLWVFSEWISESSKGQAIQRFKCPYGKVGDQLWVRETHAIQPVRSILGAVDEVYYKASCKPKHLEKVKKWRPSIHMPRWASRIQLEITDIRVERLNDISEQDAKCEGVEKLPIGWRDYKNPNLPFSDAISSFITLWRSINGEDSWRQNPWVWVVEFKRIDNA